MQSPKTRRSIKMTKSLPTTKTSKKNKDTKNFFPQPIEFVIKGHLTQFTPVKVVNKNKMTKKITENKKLPTKKANNTKLQQKSKIKKIVKTKKNDLENNKSNNSLEIKKKELKTPNNVKKCNKKPKLDTQNNKSKAKKEVKKRQTPNEKLPKESIDNKKIEDLKAKQEVIDKLLKQEKKALKPPKSTMKIKKKCSKIKKLSGGIKTEIKPKPKEKQETKGKKDDSTSDELTLEELRQKRAVNKNKLKAKTNMVLMKKRVITASKDQKNKKNKKVKLFGFWNGPKRHRVASLNALAKVHCLYENETRSNILDLEEKKEIDNKSDKSNEPLSPIPTRTLRSVPGLRAIGKHWDMHDTTSSDSECSIVNEEIPKKIKKEQKKESNKSGSDGSNKKSSVGEKKRRNRTELIMDLKDMVVRKRMASLNATAILAASYSVDKRKTSRTDNDDDQDSDATDDSSDYFMTDGEDSKKAFETEVKKEDDGKMIEVKTSPNRKVAVYLNQDTDVTITGVYVNSTTRSTHHEGYCSIAGMQYRISATSHTQTAATAVATETFLQSSSSSNQDNSNSDSLPSCKSYTPLDALSNMQPPPGPGIQHNTPHPQNVGPQHVLPLPSQLSPSGRRHGCTSAFSAPYPHPSNHHHPLPGEPGYVHGYYQPAGPLISVGHTHNQPPLTKSTPLSDTSPSPISPSSIHHQPTTTTTTTTPQQSQPPPPPPSSTGDSSDSEVIITSVTTGKESVPPAHPPGTYRYTQYPGVPPAYSYRYSHYYPTPPPAPNYAHHELCYPNPYLHHKYPYRNYLSTQYYNSPNSDMYTSPTGTPQTNQVVTATPVSANNTYPTPPSTAPTILETYPPPPPTLVETYPHPAHYYTSYAPPPPPSCYSHSPTSRPLPFINATYQSCPCPMQSCPKNVLTGPLTGDSKRSNINSIAKDSIPLPPVALALPLEPASATGPPSPARGSAGMPPPPSPAGATYHQPPQPLPPPPPTTTTTTTTTEPKQETIEANDLIIDKKRKPRIGKAMVRNNIQNTMLLMCNPTHVGEVKREIESPKEKDIVVEDDNVNDDREKNEEENKEMETDKSDECQLKKENEKINSEELPVISTVAENVKVKNMKRKLKTTTATTTESVPSKKPKTESAKYNGSYKDLIKKDVNTVKINIGKRKLNTENDDTKIKKKKPTKRKDSKQTKPLSLSNHNNSKQLKEKCVIEQQSEKEANKKKTKVKSSTAKKTAPALLDSLLAKNSIERTVTDNVEKIVRTKVKQTVKKSTNVKVNKKSECKKTVRRKSKCKEKEIVAQPIAKLPRRSLQTPRWSNGWTWEGNPYEAKVFLNSDETTVIRKCYPAMRHEEGDIIEIRDCVLLKAGPRRNELPFVAKIAALWENPDDGEMMMSLLWYYRPEHTEQGRLPTDQPDEVFASRHKDSNSVACIDDKCYVLTFHEYCRYRKNLRRLEESIEESHPYIPIPEPYPRINRQPPLQVSSDMVFFCRRVYDFRQKRIVKNPS